MLHVNEFEVKYFTVLHDASLIFIFLCSVRDVQPDLHFSSFKFNGILTSVALEYLVGLFLPMIVRGRGIF